MERLAGWQEKIMTLIPQTVCSFINNQSSYIHLEISF